jgi:hypothetical protein
MAAAIRNPFISGPSALKVDREYKARPGRTFRHAKLLPKDLMSRRLETTPARALQFTMIPKCLYCKGLGWVCENHPHKAWSDELGCHCGAGMLCECTRAESQESDINRAIVEPSKIQKAH